MLVSKLQCHVDMIVEGCVRLQVNKKLLTFRKHSKAAVMFDKIQEYTITESSLSQAKYR